MSQWPEQERGQHSTIHIDPLRGKSHSVIGATSTSQSVGGGLVFSSENGSADGRNHMLGLLRGPLGLFPTLTQDLTNWIRHLKRQDITPRRLQNTSLP